MLVLSTSITTKATAATTATGTTTSATTAIATAMAVMCSQNQSVGGNSTRGSADQLIVEQTINRKRMTNQQQQSLTAATAIFLLADYGWLAAVAAVVDAVAAVVDAVAAVVVAVVVAIVVAIGTPEFSGIGMFPLVLAIRSG